jgi:hypothetical protein
MTPPRRAALACAAALATALAARPARADGPAASSGRTVTLTMADGDRYGWVGDVAYTVAGGGMALVGTFALSPPSTDLAPLDGLGHRPFDQAADTASTVVAVTGLIVPAAIMPFVDHALGSSWRDAARVPVIFAESIAMTFGVVSMLKNALGECRPKAWSDATQTCVGTTPGSPVKDDRLSFPSLHTAPLASLAGASLGLYLLPSNDHRPQYLGLFAVTTSLAVTNFVLRPLAGAHTWVDTSAGFAIGSLVGFGTALLHTRWSAPAQVMVGTSAPQITVSGVF